MKRGVRRICKGLVPLLAVIFFALFLTGPADAQKSFYEGKMVRIVVGYPPGGGFDTFSRLFARHLKRYIPGKPSIIVVNMPGAGSLVAANRVYAMQPSDGLTIVNFHYSIALQAFLGDPAVKFDASKYHWLGEPSIGALPRVLFLRTDLGIRTLEDLKRRKEPLALAGSSRGSGDSVAGEFLRSIGLPVKNVLGYRGSAASFAAIERKEADGRITSQESVQTRYRRFLDEGVIRPILSLGKDPRLKPFPGVATLDDLNLDAGQHELADYLVKTWSHLRIFGVPPGVPAKRLAVLREAFSKAVKSPKFIKDAERQGVPVSPSSWEEIEADMKSLAQASPRILNMYKKLAGLK